MSAITSASGSTDFSSAAPGAAGAGAASPFPPRSFSITSPMGSTIVDLYSVPAGAVSVVVIVCCVAVAGASTSTNDGGA